MNIESSFLMLLVGVVAGVMLSAMMRMVRQRLSRRHGRSRSGRRRSSRRQVFHGSPHQPAMQIDELKAAWGEYAAGGVSRRPQHAAHWAFPMRWNVSGI